MNQPSESPVSRAYSYVQRNFTKPFSRKDVARQAGCSYSKLIALFRQVVGESMCSFHMHCRIDKAKQLLSQTDLRISEIAYDLGFSDNVHFAIVFKKRTGVPASQFRKLARKGLVGGDAPGEPETGSSSHEWFRDDFKGTELGDWWKPNEGIWVQEHGIIFARDSDNPSISFTRPLPENFRISVEARYSFRKTLEPSHLYLSLQSEHNSSKYCDFSVGGKRMSVGAFRHSNLGHHWNNAAVIGDNNWHRLEVEAREDTVSLHLNGRSMFHIRDPFAPSYSDRCTFSLGCWRSIVEFRNLRIESLGFSPLIRRVRQGDSLFSSQLYSRAREFYMRFMESETTHTDVMELRYKIGMCFLRERDYFQARGWLDKVITMPKSDFWARHARIAQLEIDWETQDMEVLCANAKAAFAEKSLQAGIFELLNRICSKPRNQGFHNKVLEVQQLLIALETDNPVTQTEAMITAAATCIAFGRLSKAEALLEAICEHPESYIGTKQYALHELADVLAMRGLFDESDALIARIRSGNQDQSVLARCQIYEAFNLRGKEKTQRALKMLAAVADAFPAASNDLKSFAVLGLMEMHCGLGQKVQARRAFHDLRQLYPKSSYLRPGNVSRCLCALALLGGDHRGAAQSLLDDARQSSGAAHLRANQGVRAGILYELGGDKQQARETWKEMIRRFPATHCCYYAELAEDLMTPGHSPSLEKMPYDPWARSAMFYLAGLLFEKRGILDRAKELLEMSVRNDPTLRWPAYRAKQRLKELV